jgi:hypothetical protein
VQVTTFKNNMANQRSGTRDWLLWFSFLGEGIIEIDRMCVLPEEVCLHQKMGLGALRLPGKNKKDSVYEDASSCETAVSKLRWKCTTKNDAHGVIWNLGGIL